MINFFRKIRQNNLKEGKTVNYLKYAIGEVLLIFIGVIIALSASQWNNNKNNLAYEVKALKEIYKGLQLDYSTLEILINNTEKGIKSITTLDSLLNKDKLIIISQWTLYSELFMDLDSFRWKRQTMKI